MSAFDPKRTFWPQYFSLICVKEGGHRDTRRIQHHLGHASITNTVRYTALSPEASRDIWR